LPRSTAWVKAASKDAVESCSVGITVVYPKVGTPPDPLEQKFVAVGSALQVTDS
jgi:hypothetical protein